MPKRIRVLIVDDSRLVRDGLSAVLSAEPDLQVVATAADVVDGLHQIATITPDVVLIDADLARGDQNRCVRQVRVSNHVARVVVMNLEPTPVEVVALAKAGANGFMTKDAAVEDLVAAVRSVAGGTNMIPPAVAGMLLSHFARERSLSGSPETPKEVRLTEREREIMELIAEGLGNKAIAHRLHVADETVKSHVRNMLEKLALHSRLELAAHRHRAG